MKLLKVQYLYCFVRYSKSSGMLISGTVFAKPQKTVKRWPKLAAIQTDFILKQALSKRLYIIPYFILNHLLLSIPFIIRADN